jgi:maleamate amidohydrolase
MTTQRRPWLPFLTSVDRQVLERGYYGHGDDDAFGSAPCLLIVDVQRYVVGEDAPILDQIDRYPSGVGARAWRAVESIALLLKEARLSEIPVAYSMLVAKEDSDLSLYGQRIRRRWLFGPEDALAQIPQAISPQTSAGRELVFHKYFPSAFFGTPLNTWLIRRAVDTLIVVGGSTSGCVRASAVDASSLGYKVVVVADCTFDRIEVSHATSLLDIWMKYGAVTMREQVAAYLQMLRAKT